MPRFDIVHNDIKPSSHTCSFNEQPDRRNLVQSLQCKVIMVPAVAVIADRTAYNVRHRLLVNYQTGFGYKLTNGWYARSYSTGRVYERTQTLSTQA